MAPKNPRFWDNVISMAIKQAKKDCEIVKRYATLFKDGEFHETQGASANHTFSDVSLLMAVLNARDPNIDVKPESLGDLPYFQPLVGMMFPTLADAHTAFADTIEKIETFNWRETKTRVHIDAGLWFGVVTGMGVFKVSFDEKKMCSRVDTLRRDEVFIDPNARYDITQAEYIVQTCAYPIEQAREFFASIGMAGAEQLQANFRLNEDKGLTGEMAKDNAPSDGATHFRFFEIWHKAGEERKVYYRKYDEKVWLFQRDWPFLLAVDEFCYEIITFSKQYHQIQDAFTDLHPINGLRRSYEWAMEFYRRHIFKCAATKVVYDKGIFNKDNEDDLLNEEDMKFIGVALNGRSVDSVIQKVDMTEDAAAMVELAGHLKSVKDQIFGIDDIQRGSQGKRVSATQAQLSDEYGKARTGKKTSQFDETLIALTIKRAQIDMQLMPPEKVARIAGQAAATLWQTYGGDAEELRCQYSIGITAGSTGEKAKEKELADMQMFFKDAQAVNQTQPAPVFDVVKIFMDMVKLKGIPHAERYVIGPLMPKDAGLPGQTPMDPNGAQGVGPGGQAPMENGPNEQPEMGAGEPGANQVEGPVNGASMMQGFQ